MSETAVHGVKQQSASMEAPFNVISREVVCPYKFQFYVDYGTSQDGPWLKMGLNDTELGIGYLPKQGTGLNVVTSK